jgi:TolB protein
VRLAGGRLPSIGEILMARAQVQLMRLGRLMLVAMVCCWPFSAVQAQPTFSVQGVGRALTKLNLTLEPGVGVDRPAMLRMAQATQQALHSTGFFSVGIVAPGEVGVGARDWGRTEATIPVRIGADREGGTSRRIAIEVQDGGFGRSNYLRQFAISGGSDRDAGQAVADVLYEYFLQRKGYFTSRILYVRQAMEGGRRVYQIVSSDLFGEGLQVHVSSRSELASPQLAPDGRALVFVAIRNERPQLYRKTFGSGGEVPVFSDREVRFSPAFDRAGNLYYTKVVLGNSDLYRAQLGSNQEQRLTTSPAIDTAPAPNPAGDRIAFVSDESGRQRVVVRPLAGGAPWALGNLAGNYGSPAFSPDGKQVALTRQSGGAFSIGAVNIETGEEKVFSSSFFEEHPIWAPNGKVIVFERDARNDGADAGLWQVDAETNYVFRLPIAGKPRDPAWIRPGGQ